MIRPMTRTLTALLALLALGVAAPAPAPAQTRDKIIADCADDGQLSGKYSPSDLRDARKNLPSDVAEYTDCADVLRRAELGDGGATGGGTSDGGGFPGGGGTSGSGGSSTPLTPANDEERAALARAQTEGAAPVEINGEAVVPGAAGFSPNATRNGMPASLLFAIIALALLGIGGLVYAVRDRLPSLSHLVPFRGH